MKKPIDFGKLLVIVAMIVAAGCAIWVNWPNDATRAASISSRAGNSIGSYLNECSIKNPPLEKCGTHKSVLRHFGINLTGAIQYEHDRMKATARKIERRNLREDEYARCQKNDTCATVPLLAIGLDPYSAAAQSPKNMHIRRAFWDLVRKEHLTPAICDFMPLCTTSRQNGAFSLSRKYGRVQ